MEINEAIRVMEFFLHKQCSLGRMKFTPYDDDNLIWHVVNDVFEEWKWYREQDLIRREDVKNDEVLKEIALGFEREFLKTVMMIPKAEHKYSGCSYDIFCEKIDCKGCEAEPKAEYRGNEDAD